MLPHVLMACAILAFAKAASVTFDRFWLALKEDRVFDFIFWAALLVILLQFTNGFLGAYFDVLKELYTCGRLGCRSLLPLP